ncbi:unnamed protein product [Caenorhabditis bovis]|uniref:Uncharacterized protein n=1 Tax=Caenorhabditis bovis TaxID=2654633 RepID=A0A8S1F1H3_9PELO|nr:unnamed protein product [Caenorhabditis bovis]
MGFSRLNRSNLISPAVVLTDYLLSKPAKFKNAQIYLIGVENLKTTLETEAQVKCFGTGPDHKENYTENDFIFDIDVGNKPKAVVVSFDSHFSYPKLMKAANYLKDDDVELLVTNEDDTFPGPVAGVVLPETAPWSHAIQTASRRTPTRIFGKPERAMSEFLKKRAGGKLDPKRTVMFGDRLASDTQFANSNGFTSVWMQTGVNTVDDIEKARRNGEDLKIPNYTHMVFTPMTPESSFQFADLNIKHKDPETTLNMVRRAIRMGYDSVAINIDIGDISQYHTEADMIWTPGCDSESFEPPTKKKKKQQKAENELSNGVSALLRKKYIPLPYFVDLAELNTVELEKRGKIFRQFSRLTFTANEQIVLNKTFIHPTVMKYDLVAVRPGDGSVLETLSRKTELFDIITIDRLENDKAKWLGYSKVIERMRGDGIYYELTYAECLMPETRKQALYNGRVLLRSLKSRHVLISSGAECMLDLRAPVDVMNLSLLWGVESSEARKFVSGWPKNLLLQAECRGTENGDLHSMKIDEAEQFESKGPPIEIRMNNIQYEALMKATKNANEMLKSIKEKTKNAATPKNA